MTKQQSIAAGKARRPEIKCEQKSTAKEFVFDCVLAATLRVKAESQEEALELLYEKLDCADANFGCWNDGEPITGEVSLDGVTIV